MDLHLTTLFVVLSSLAVTLTLVVGVLAWRSRNDGLPVFTAGMALHVLTYGAVGLRGRLDDFTLLVVANIALSSAMALACEALYRFQRRPSPRLLVWAPPLLVVLAQPWLYGQPQHRVIVMSLILAAQCLTQLAALVQRRRQTVGVGQYLLGVNILAILALLTFRVVSVATSTRPSAEVLAQVHGVTFLLAAMMDVVMVLSFIIMAKEAADERNRVLAMRDELTGLGNRRTLLDGLEQQSALAQRSGMPLTVLVIDIDHFKQVNDSFGHPSGDLALRGVAQLLESALRRQDVVGRMGGEEFMVILPCTPKANAGLLAEKLRRAVEQASFAAVDGRRMALTISIGLHEFDPQSETRIEDVIRVADEALYRAKSEGRNRVVAA